MKLHLQSRQSDQYLIEAVTAEGITVNGKNYASSLVVMTGQLIADWPPTRIDELKAEHLAPVLAAKPEVFILGTGERQQFPQPAILKAFYEQRIGVEVMDTAAACRTYNILLGEARIVAAGLIIAS